MSCECNSSKGGKGGKGGKDDKDDQDDKGGKNGIAKDSNDGKSVDKDVKDSNDDQAVKDANDGQSVDDGEDEDYLDVQECNDNKDVGESTAIWFDQDDKEKYVEDKKEKNEKKYEHKEFQSIEVPLIYPNVQTFPSYKSYGNTKYRRDDFLWSMNSIAKIIACLTYLISAVLFYFEPEDDTTLYQFYGTPWLTMLPVLDVVCGISVIFVYVGMVILLSKNKITYMILLDVTMAMATTILLLVSILILLDDENSMALYIQRVAAAVALLGLAFQVCSGFLTVIYYHPNKYKRNNLRKENATRTSKEPAIRRRSKEPATRTSITQKITRYSIE